MIKITSEQNCCGCAACLAACPQNCILMEKGTLGHFFSLVDEALCNNCGICNRVCPMENSIITTDFTKKAYAAHSLDKGVRYRGSSGGMFETFSIHLLSNGYSVYGAAFDSNLQLKCTCATNETELLPLMKSKYLQSDFREKYTEIQTKLRNNEKVFVVSTPCQIAALKRFLKNDYANLITVDFFCHGVPSQHFFDVCNRYDELKKYLGKIRRYNFRSKKKNGTTPHYYTVEYEKSGKTKKKTRYYFDSTFYAFFQQYFSLRESCYNCRFSEVSRYSDITIADFHEIDRYYNGINRFDGVSTVVLNTSRGHDLFDNCKDTLFILEMNIEKLIADDICFSGGTPRPSNRDKFLKDYNTMNIEDLANKYVNQKRYIKNRIYYSLPSPIRKIIKKHIGV